MSDIDHGFIEELRWNVSDAHEFQKKTGQDAVNVLQALSGWLCADNRAHYMCIDTKKIDDDGRNLAAVAHSLCAEEQFVAVHQLLESSRQQRLRESGEIPPGAILNI